MLEIEEFDESLVQELRMRAKDLLLARAIASEELIGDDRPEDELLRWKEWMSSWLFNLLRQG